MSQTNEIKQVLCETLTSSLLLAVGARTTEQTERAILLAGEIAAELDAASVKACQREADSILKARYN